MLQKKKSQIKDLGNRERTTLDKTLVDFFTF